jgi:hypothetical protein
MKLVLEYKMPIGKKTDIKGAKLGVGILVAYAPFEGAHGVLRRDGFRAYDIGDLEVEGNVFTFRSQYLLVNSAG